MNIRHPSSILAFSLIFAACTKAAPPAATPTAAATPNHAGLRIKLTSVFVDDQEKALRFYTDVLGFVKKDDFTNSGYRWLTVTSPGDADGGELLLELNADPAAKAYQQARFSQSQPAVMFYTGDVKGQFERIKARGAKFTMTPTEVTAGSVIATLDDTCGNLVQLTQLAH
jgi:predicted enzyme related to lactoylglutathione lyase